MPPSFQDYYSILGVPRDASPEAIKRAYRSLARRHHPDVASDKVAAEERFKSINEAYSVLSNPDHRRKYDALGADWNRAGAAPAWQDAASGRAGAGRSPWQEASGDPSTRGGFGFEGTGFSDFFEALFGSGFRPGSGPVRDAGPDASGPMPTADVEADIAVSLEEVLRGSERSIRLHAAPPSSGIPAEPGPVRSFRVRIPPGVRPGQRIRVAAMGPPAPRGGPPGDLYLRVRYQPHPEFQEQEGHLLTDLELPPWDFVLGATVAVPTLDAPVQIRVPAGTQPDQVFRVRGQGLPLPSAGQRGDLLVQLKLRIPSQVSPQQLAAWQSVATAHQSGNPPA